MPAKAVTRFLYFVVLLVSNLHCSPPSHNKMEFPFMHKRPLKKLLCAVAAAIGLSASLTASAADPLKVGFVSVSYTHLTLPTTPYV